MGDFWKTLEHIPADRGFGLYSLSHWMWLLGICVGICAAVFGYRHLGAQGQRRVQRTAVWLMLAMELLKDCVLLGTGQFRAVYLPLDLCGLSIFLELAGVYAPHPLLLELVYSLSLPGACLALLFPNWNGLPLWNFFSLHSFLLHGLLVLVPVLQLASGQMRPCWKRLPFCFTCIAAACVPIALVNRCLGTNFFFLARPSKGSPLVWFEEMFGNHLIGLPLLMALIWAGMYGGTALLCWQRKRKKHL